ncbi:hypothetical protein XPA_006968 [Xanthoria parietina]
MVLEMDVLHFNLSQLDNLLRRHTGAAFSSTSVLTTSTHACRNKLDMLHDKLERAAEHPLHRLRWPLSSDEHQKTLGELRAFAQWIQFALTIDGSSLLAKTSTEVIDVLSKQLQMFQLLDQVDTRTALTNNTVMDLQHVVRTSDVSRERESILKWLSNAKPSQKHHDVRLPRVAGTGGWLLEESTFKKWRDAEENLLWCYGIQGSGKSILASLVIDHLSHTFPSHQVVVAHTYFDYRDQHHQSVEQTIASLLKQVASGLPKMPAAVANLYQKYGKQKQTPQLQDLVQALSSSCGEYNAVYIVIDALDEYESKSRKGLLNLLYELKDYAKVFVSSRPYPEEIRKAFGRTPQIEIKAHSTDLELYINRQIEDSDIVDDINDTFRKQLVSKIVQSAQEMFLLAVLHVQAVLEEPTTGDMEEALDRLPQNLHAAFEDTIQRIKRQSETRSRIALQALTLICRARRPLVLNELVDALAFRPQLVTVSPNHRPPRKTVLDSCHGLVTVDEESQIIRLVHYSVYSFLQGAEEDLIRDERFIAKLCVEYQMLQPFTLGSCQDEDEIMNRLNHCPFIEYAARYWGSHVLAAKDSTIDERALNFLRARPQLACSYQIWQYAKGRREEYWKAEEAVSCNSLHMAAMFGLQNLAAKLLPLYTIDKPTHMGTTALMQAASCGHRSLVCLFMEKDADATKHNWYGTALHAAAEAGEVDCIHELVDRGVNVDIEDHHGRAPLICAAEEGRTGAICALLERGANVNSIYRGRGTPLGVAIQIAVSPMIIRMLLEKGADPNIPDAYGSSPLHMAAKDCDDDTEIARDLLEYGADVDARGEKGRTPLQIAAESNNVTHLQLFLDCGADIDAQSDDGATAISTASRLRRDDAVRHLLMEGAELQIHNKLDITPLNYVEHYQDMTLVQTLLVSRADKKTSYNDEHTARWIRKVDMLRRGGIRAERPRS